MGHRVEGNKLIIEFDPNSQTLSKSGKSYLLASSSGFRTETLDDGTEIKVLYNVIKSRD